MKPYPKLRPVEAFPVEHGGERLIVVHDPSGLAQGPITVSPAAMFVLLMLDGQKGPRAVQQAFAEQFGQPIPPEQLEGLVGQLDTAGYLESDAFARHYRSLVDGYRAAPARLCRDLSAYGIDVFDEGRARGETAGEQAVPDHGDRDVADILKADLARMLSRCEVSLIGKRTRRLAGLIAPHLDYGRGTPCYADAYAVLATAEPVRRVVILGTNHYGRATSVAATRKDFQTPLGTTRTDRAFLEALEARCGVDLCEHEFDHAREHSVELQVLILQFLLGAGNFEIVPALCHDPCGPTGTAPYDGKGADLRVFGEALGDLIRSDPTPTLIIAGADLSHVGRRFGDDRELEPAFLSDVERKDREALQEIIAGRQEDFVRKLAGRENATRVCSAGCIFALRTALNGAAGELLRYHQAVDRPGGTCVTCCAAAFWA
jgi:AmmeMemoRadiSam system protein B